MAILAIDPRMGTLQVAVSDGNRYETSTFPLPSIEDTVLEEQLLSWLEALEVKRGTIQRIIAPNRHLELSDKLSRVLNAPVRIMDQAHLSGSYACVTGTPWLERRCLAETFIFTYLVKQESRMRSIALDEGRFIVAHLDERHQLGALCGQEALDVLTSLDEGPFALRESGGLPFDRVLDLCMEGNSRDEVLHILQEKGGLAGYLGLKNLEELWICKAEGADLIREALIYQIAKEIGALATVLEGDVDSIILSGDLTKYKPFVSALRERIDFIAHVSVHPGNQTLSALLADAQGHVPNARIKIEE